MPEAFYPDALTIGQLARTWEHPVAFVRRMITEGKLAVDDQGLISTASQHAFHRAHGTELH